MKWNVWKTALAATVTYGLLPITGCNEGANEPLSDHHHTHEFSQEVEGEHPHTLPDGVVFENTLEITDEILAEIDIYLEMLAYGLIDLASDQDFIDLLSSKVSEQFDGDDNVLLRDLKSACEEMEIDLEDMMSSSIEAHAPLEIQERVTDLGLILEAISYEGVNFYPQIYIPFYESIVSEDSPSAIIPLTSDVYETADEYPGFSPDIIDGEVAGYNNTQISQDDAENDVVWVVSINERVNYKGDFDPVYQGVKPRMGCPPTKWLEFFPSMTIHDGKEKWISGKSEIYYAFSQYDPTDGGNPTRFSYEKDIKKIARDDIGDPFDIHDEITNDWSWCDRGLALLIYERDRPAKGKVWAYVGGGALEFKSKQDEYWRGILDEGTYMGIGTWQGTITTHSAASQIDFSLRGREN